MIDRRLVDWLRERMTTLNPKTLLREVASAFPDATARDVKAALAEMGDQERAAARWRDIAIKVIERASVAAGKPTETLTLEQAANILGVGDPDVVALLHELWVIDSKAPQSQQ